MCENILFLRLLKYFNTALSLMRFIVPIILIVKLTIDIYKGIIEVGDNSAKEKILKRVIACVIIFLVPTIINVFLSLFETIFGSNFNYSACVYNIENIDYLKEVEELEERLKYEKESSINYQKYQEAISDLNSKISQNNSASLEAIVIGQKYTNLSDEDVKKLCGVAIEEQGSIPGAKAEASLIANRYELLSTSNSYYGKGIVNYVKNSGWFHNAASHMHTECPSDYLQAVRDVLVNGNRTLPLYVDEHDYTGDISKIVTNGQKLTSGFKNHSNYIKDSTVIYNKMGAVYTFYVFPTDDEGSDPFGYTQKARERFNDMNK